MASVVAVRMATLTNLRGTEKGIMKVQTTALLLVSSGFDLHQSWTTSDLLQKQSTRPQSRHLAMRLFHLSRILFICMSLILALIVIMKHCLHPRLVKEKSITGLTFTSQDMTPVETFKFEDAVIFTIIPPLNHHTIMTLLRSLVGVHFNSYALIICS